MKKKLIYVLLFIISSHLSFSQEEVKTQKTIYKLGTKDGKTLTLTQVDSLGSAHNNDIGVEIIEVSKTEKLIILLTPALQKANSNLSKGGGFQATATLNEDDSTYTVTIKGEKALVEKWKGKPIFDAVLMDMNDNSYNIGSGQKKITVLNIWYTSCSPCIKEMPELNQLVKKYEKNSQVQFLAMTFNMSEEIQRFLKKWDFDYKIIPNVKTEIDKIWTKNEDGTTSKIYPLHFVVDENGKVQEFIMGAKEDIHKMLESALKKLL